MKKTIHFAFILFCIFMQANLFANTVIVKGIVKDANNNPVANKTVKIYTDSTFSGCALSHTRVTNPNGYYIDTLTCNGDIRQLKILVENCNGSLLINTPQLNATSNIIESNFTICVRPSTTPVNCKAAFTYTATATGVKLNGADSETPDGDSIISRTWFFGDDTEAVSGNKLDLIHAYKKPGIYTVCLYIKTKKGCESKYCATVVFEPESTDCKVEVRLDNEKLGPKKFRFYSSLSNTLQGDSIVQRTWKFGDGSSLDGNQSSPVKEYKDSGNYNVCVQVRTKKGCEKLFCFNVTVRDSIPGIEPKPVNCHAYFTYTIKDSTIFFNSEGCTASSPGDSIISRTWYYNDNNNNANTLSLSGNAIKPSYTYSKPGKYSVYLVIKTKKGCESKYALHVVIPEVFSECHIQIQVNIEKSNASVRKVRFTSNTSTAARGDSIVKRIWKFGDNTSLEGNEIYPWKEYKDTGTYTVCIKVKTARGCEKEYCFKVIIRDTIASTHCKAVFTYTTVSQLAGTATGIKFNSSGSVAAAGDSIISRTWVFGDSTDRLTGNRIDPTHSFTKPGIYNVCLYIKTRKGCESNYCTTITIRPTLVICQAQAHIAFERIHLKKIRFNSNQSTVQLGDSITHRKWKFGDGTELQGNEINPLKEYRDTGVYSVCLKIITAKGCEKEYCIKVIIRDSISPVPANCKALFRYEIQNEGVKFTSTSSAASSQDDSIISRTWHFGDNTDKLTGNSIAPSHAYTKAGIYEVYLYIKTKKGCESKYAATVVIAPVNCAAIVQFSAERSALKKVQFNSSLTTIPAGDSIIERRWKFGDGTALEGNVVSPLKAFPIQGVYNTCLQIKTAKGCETQLCKQVVVQDSVGLPESSVDYIKIMSINPNPVITRMMATIWSRNHNTEVEISIYDMYGTGKLTVKKLLAQGNNIIEMATSSLYHGPYFLKISSRNGRDTKAFYKL